ARKPRLSPVSESRSPELPYPPPPTARVPGRHVAPPPRNRPPPPRPREARVRTTARSVTIEILHVPQGHGVGRINTQYRFELDPGLVHHPQHRVGEGQVVPAFEIRGIEVDGTLQLLDRLVEHAGEAVDEPQ